MGAKSLICCNVDSPLVDARGSMCLGLSPSTPRFSPSDRHSLRDVSRRSAELVALAV